MADTVALKTLLDDTLYWLSNNVYDSDELAIRFKHHLVSIRCFSNGNGRHSRLIADILKQNNAGVILAKIHESPSADDDAIDRKYTTAAALHKAGVIFTVCDDSQRGFWRQRNLPFMAGTMAAYGLTKEEALSVITLNAAKLLGIDNITGTLEKGKDANIVISEGDILDMRTSKITNAFIQGREIDLNNKQTQLFEKYKYKYGIK